MNALCTSILRVNVNLKGVTNPHFSTSRNFQRELRKNCQGLNLPLRSSSHFRCFSGDPSSQKAGNDKNNLDNEMNLSYTHRIKLLWTRYGYIAFGIYSSLGFVTVASIYVGIDQGFIDPVYWLDLGETVVEKVKKESNVIENKLEANAPTGLTTTVVALLDKSELTKPFIPRVEDNPVLLNLAAAWLVMKMAEPLRLAVTLSIVPKIARFIGYVPNEMKTPPK